MITIILLFLSLVSVSFLCFYIFQTLSSSQTSIFKKYHRQFIRLATASMLFITIAALIEFMEIIKIEYCKNLFTGIFIVSFVAVILFLSAEVVKKSDKDVFFNICSTKTLFYIIKTVCIAFVVISICEFAVFNFKSYHLIDGKYQTTVMDINTAQTEGFDRSPENTLISTGRNPSIKFENVNRMVGTVYFNAQFTGENQSKFEVAVQYSDETSQSMRGDGVNFNVIRNSERDKYGVFKFSGKINTIIFGVNLPENTSIKIDSIVLNEPVPVNYNLIRVFMFMLIILTLCFLIRLPMFKTNYKDTNIKQKTAVIIITSIMIISLFAIVAIRDKSDFQSIVNDFKSTTGNQMTKTQVDAFRQGQVELLEKPSKELLELNNPYDWGERSEKGVSYLWDHLLFEGKYFSYYGIAPVAIIFLPYNIITDYYFPSNWACVIFSALGILYLAKLYMVFAKKMFPDVDFGLVCAGLITVLAASGAWFCVSWTNFYEIAQSSGFFCVVAGAYYIISSNIITKGKISYCKLAFGTTFLSLSVMCRPTLAAYSIAVLPFLYYGFKKIVADSRNEEFRDIYKKSAPILYLAAAFIPFILLGGFQMYFNYIRFHSPLDFGINYSLTIDDFTRSQYHTNKAALGFYNFLFTLPQLNQYFPYIYSKYDTLGINGRYFTGNSHAIGIFWRALPVCSFFLVPKLLRKFDIKNKIKFLLLWSFPCIIAPFIIIFSIWPSGYVVRYFADFSWAMVIGAFFIIYYLYTHSKKPDLKAFARKTVITSGIISLIVNMAMVYPYTVDVFPDNVKAWFYALESSFSIF